MRIEPFNITIIVFIVDFYNDQKSQGVRETGYLGSVHELDSEVIHRPNTSSVSY